MKTSYIIFICVMSLLAFVSCQKSEDDAKNEKITRQSLINNICTNWDASKADLESKFSNNSKTETDNLVTCQTSKQDAYLTYEFDDDVLQSTTLILTAPTETEVDNICKNYTHIGTYSSTDVYTDNTSSTVMLKFEQTKNNEQYTVFAFSPIE